MSVASQSREIAEGYGISLELAEKIVRVAKRVGIPNPAMLANVIYYESGLTFSPAAEHPDSGAVGLIQFLPSVAREVGTSTSELKRMTAVQQMDYVEKYFMLPRIRQGCPEPGGKRATGPEGCGMSVLPYKDQGDVYAAVFYPPGRRDRSIRLTGRAAAINVVQSPAAYTAKATAVILAQGVPVHLADPGRYFSVVIPGAIATALLAGGFIFWLSMKKREARAASNNPYLLE